MLGEVKGAAMAPQRLRVGPVHGPTVVGVLAAGVLVTALVIAGRSLSGASGHPAARPPSAPTAAVVPLSLGPTWSCPLAAPVPGFVDRRSYPPGHPAAPPRSLRPVACYQDSVQATAAGYPPAPPPPGTLEAGGIYLTPTGNQLQRRCQHAADRLGFPVPCPALLPAMAPGAVPPAPCDDERFGCEWGTGFVLEQEGFVVPPGYGGFAGQAVQGRLAVAAASRPADNVVACEGRQQSVATVTPHGIRGRMLQCAGAGVHFDSVLVRWRERGVFMVVSVLGHGRPQQQLALTVAEHVRVVSPGRQAR
jgi:hypothetical protein